MFSRGALRALPLAERQALWHQARRRGQCVRCFYASTQRSAENEVSGKGASVEESAKGSPKANLVENVQARPGPPDSFDSASPHQPTKPASQQDRKRHQRSAMISEEVQMVQRDHPFPSFADVNPNLHSDQPPVTAQTLNPEGSAMGENDPVSREGPTGQGLGKAVVTDEDVPDTSGLARGARSPHEGVEEPAAGGAAVIGTPGQGRQTVNLVEDGGNDAAEDAFEMAGSESVAQPRRRVLPTEVVEPAQVLSKEALLHSGYETSTLAAGDMHSVTLDHLRPVAHPGEQPQTERDPQQLAEKMMAGQLVHFHSTSEKSAAEERARKIADRRAKNCAKQKGLDSGEVQPEAKNYHFSPAPQSVRKGIVDKVLRGVYDPDDVLKEGSPKYKNQPLLNQLAQQAMKNSTYTPRDSERFLRKLQGLLPRQVPQQAQRGGQTGQKQPRAKTA